MKYAITVMLVALGLSSQAQFSRLHVRTPAGSQVGISAGSSANTRIIAINHDGTSGTISTGTLNGATDNSPMKFVTAGQVRMTIFENGYVGIGTSGAPTAELTVGGKIHAREVKVYVSAGSGPDYVFGADYTLPSLCETAAYIRQHKHLPEVPPAAEMESHGVNLSEMNMLLLKKVEELTLHLIDQNSQVEMLKQQLEKQQKQIDALQKAH